MKKFRLYFLIIVVLMGATIWLIVHKTSGAGELKEKAFAVQNSNDISRIVMEDLDKKKIELTKTNGIWMVNGKFTAREELLQSLLEAITRVTILCPVPKAAHDNVVRQMLGKNIKVEIYASGADKPLKTYYVGGPTTDNEGTYMLLEIDGKPMARPYITYLPGKRGYLTFRYTTDEENWRSHSLFNYGEGDIKSLSVEYPAEENKSFTIHKLSSDSFSLVPMFEEKHRQDYHQNYIRQYLSFYSDISIEAYDNNFSKKDSTLHTTPYCIFTITGKNDSVNKVKLFYMPVSQRSKQQFDEKGNEMTYDVDHFHASINNDKDFVIVQYYVFGKLLRVYDDFFFTPVKAVGK